MKSCWAAISSTVVEEEKRKFGVEEAGLLVKDLRNSFNSGKTKTYEWRKSQLEGIAKMVQEKENDILEALYKDLAKPPTESFVSEVILYLFHLNFIVT